ncbi:MAG TPA: primosomal protein N' [Spirochaetia bacterium]|nr:primosomal protein N' [Spirochaetia bacterium]
MDRDNPLTSPPAFAQVVFNLPVPGPFTYSVPEEMRCEVGSRVIVPMGRKTMAGFVVARIPNPPAGVRGIKSVSRVIDREPLFDAEYLKLAYWMSDLYLATPGECLSAMIPGGRREVELPAIGGDETSFSALPFSLTDEQEQAVHTITSAESGNFYLFGITGSGKTEVFLQAASKTLVEGRSIIYLVPEISLTHQVTETIRRRFYETAAVLHSGLTASQRLTEWRRIQSGEARFVIGARSAVFAPVTRLGLIIIDEEHEGSYKSGAAPRYHARQIAMKRCAESRARLVMGSATPSVEAFHLMREKRLAQVTLSRRPAGGTMPHVQIVSLRRQEGAISPLLADAIRATHGEGRQTILFLNRRGFAYFFHCRSCGYEMTCRHCSVGMTYHKNRNLMVCHYCGYRSSPIDSCPDCGSLDIGYSGFGTQRIEEEVAASFPGYRVARVDTDSVKKKGSLERTIAAFRDGTIDILLGTQMVAKGLNFPGVKLVGIVLADTGLHLPDFRAAERTFDLIVQVSGRAGRFMPDGQVIIQTMHPDNDAIRLAAGNRLDEFYSGELAVRRALRFPPFSRLFRIVFRGKDKDRVSHTAEEFARLAVTRLEGSAELLGPAECPIGKIALNHRFQIVCKVYRFDAGHTALRDTIARFRRPRDVHLEIDIDPVSLL